jgi:hypothetical protein
MGVARDDERVCTTYDGINHHIAHTLTEVSQ